MIPVCVSANGLDYIHKRNIALKNLTPINEICKNHPSDHYMITPETIQKLVININGSTIEVYMQTKPQEIFSFIKCVLPKYHLHEAPIIKYWVIQKRKHNRVVKYEEIFYLLKVMFNITPCTKEKFQEIIERIYNAILASDFQISHTRTKRPNENSVRYND